MWLIVKYLNYYVGNMTCGVREWAPTVRVAFYLK